MVSPFYFNFFWICQCTRESVVKHVTWLCYHIGYVFAPFMFRFSPVYKCLLIDVFRDILIRHWKNNLQIKHLQDVKFSSHKKSETRSWIRNATMHNTNESKSFCALCSIHLNSQHALRQRIEFSEHRFITI